MPKDRAADGGWIDEWDEADDTSAEQGSGLRAEGLGSEDQQAKEPNNLESLSETDTEPATDDRQPNLPWRVVIRNTPLWIWLISSTALFGICA